MNPSQTVPMGALKALVLCTACALTCAAHASEATSLLDSGSYRPLTADRRAAQPGDLLTVVIQEQASALSTVDANAARSNGASIQIDPFKGVGRNASANLGSETTGGGRTQRSGRLLAQLTVRVEEVLPNGDFRIAGMQNLQINNETQKIELRGRVRQRDISDGNVVPSTRIADAEIRFEGEGFASEKSRPGWVGRFLSFFGL